MTFERSFEDRGTTPGFANWEFSPNLWETVRNRAIPPTFTGPTSADQRKRAEFLRGASAMGYDLVDLDDDQAMAALAGTSPRRYALQPQQLLLVDTLNAPGDDYVVEIVRRASKTTTIFCLLLGRCLARPGYLVTFSAQNGVKGTTRLREWKRRLDVITPPDDLDLPPWLRNQPRQRTRRATRQLSLFGEDLWESLSTTEDATPRRGFRIMTGEVAKGIYFDNGSQFLVLKPDPEAYRGEAGDVSWIDEAQEIDPTEADELLAGILPLQDTRDAESAVILSGTAGLRREGPFWERVARMRGGDPTVGGVDYCAGEDVTLDQLDDMDAAMTVLTAVHPGLGTLTTLDKMEKRWARMPRAQFAREYLSIWPEDHTAGAIDLSRWGGGAITEDPAAWDRPDGVAFGFMVDPHGDESGAIVAAWRDEDGTAYLELIAHRPGTDWMPGELIRLGQKYRRPFGYDAVGAQIGVADAVATQARAARQRAPKLEPINLGGMKVACSTLLRDIVRGRVRHFDQPPLNEAVRVAAKRYISETGWVWSLKQSHGDITPLVSATLALRVYDQAPHRAARSGLVMGRTG